MKAKLFVESIWDFIWELVPHIVQQLKIFQARNIFKN